MTATVWVTGTRNIHVHKAPDCRGIKRGQAHGLATEVREVPLVDVFHPDPCRWCWPEAPELRVWHPTCQVCGHVKPIPCPHNGAVLVLQPRHGQWTGQWGTSEYDADSVTYQRRWVWPENAHRYSLVNPAH